LRNNAIFFLGSMMVAFLNYLYYPVIGRLMSTSSFGEAQATIALFLQVGIFLQVLSLVIISAIKRYSEPTERNHILGELEQGAILTGLFIFAFVVASSVTLQHFLNFATPYPFWALALAVLVSIPLAFSNSFLQGKQKFNFLARSSILASTLKLASGVILLLLGFGAFGAVMGIVVAQALALVYSRYQSRHQGMQPLRFGLRLPKLAAIRPELKYAALVFVTFLCVNILLSLDVVAVKHYFSPEIAGQYAGISTVGRIIFFLTGSFAAVMIAAVKMGEHAANVAFLKRSTLLTVGLGGVGLVVFCLFPQQIIQLLMGTRYLAYASLLPLLSVAIFTLSLANLFIYYHIALHRIWSAPVAFIGMATGGVLIAMHNQTIAAIITDVLVGGVVMLVLVVLGSIWQNKSTLSVGNENTNAQN
jgi:O-antigen/teichoic acid export membrane protein